MSEEKKREEELNLLPLLLRRRRRRRRPLLSEIYSLNTSVLPNDRTARLAGQHHQA